MKNIYRKKRNMETEIKDVNKRKRANWDLIKKRTGIIFEGANGANEKKNGWLNWDNNNMTESASQKKTNQQKIYGGYLKRS